MGRRGVTPFQHVPSDASTPLENHAVKQEQLFENKSRTDDANFN